MSLTERVREFRQDLLDRSAVQRQGSPAIETPSSVFIVIATVASYLKATREFVVDAVGLPGVFVLPLLAFATLAACVVVISSKHRLDAQPGFTMQVEAKRQYSYGSWTRGFAK